MMQQKISVLILSLLTSVNLICNPQETANQKKVAFCETASCDNPYSNEAPYDEPVDFNVSEQKPIEKKDDNSQKYDKLTSIYQEQFSNLMQCCKLKSVADQYDQRKNNVFYHFVEENLAFTIEERILRIKQVLELIKLLQSEKYSRKDAFIALECVISEQNRRFINSSAVVKMLWQYAYLHKQELENIVINFIKNLETHENAAAASKALQDLFGLETIDALERNTTTGVVRDTSYIELRRIVDNNPRSSNQKENSPTNTSLSERSHSFEKSTLKSLLKTSQKIENIQQAFLDEDILNNKLKELVTLTFCMEKFSFSQRAVSYCPKTEEDISFIWSTKGFLDELEKSAAEALHLKCRGPKRKWRMKSFSKKELIERLGLLLNQKIATLQHKQKYSSTTPEEKTLIEDFIKAYFNEEKVLNETTELPANSENSSMEGKNKETLAQNNKENSPTTTQTHKHSSPLKREEGFSTPAALGIIGACWLTTVIAGYFLFIKPLQKKSLPIKNANKEAAENEVVEKEPAANTEEYTENNPEKKAEELAEKIAKDVVIELADNADNLEK